MSTGTWPEAVRYWESHRIGYNIALSLQAAGWVILTWPHFQPAFHLDSLGKLFVLALLANVCYSAAYLVEIPMLESFADRWRRRRWVLWSGGVLLALLLEFYWIGDEIYPYV